MQQIENTLFYSLTHVILFPFPTPLDKHCTVRFDWQSMRKSDIRYPRATADLRPAEGHTEIIKCQAHGNMWREGTWPTWHYHTRGLHCPERDFTSIRQADRPNWQQLYGYFPWQLAEPTGFLERGGRLCDIVQVYRLLSIMSTYQYISVGIVLITVSEIVQCGKSVF